MSIIKLIIKSFSDNKSRESPVHIEQEVVKDDYFCDTNQSQSPSDTVKEFIIDDDVSKNIVEIRFLKTLKFQKIR